MPTRSFGRNKKNSKINTHLKYILSNEATEWISCKISSVYKFGIRSSSKAFRSFCIFDVTPDNLKKKKIQFKIPSKLIPLCVI